MRQKRYAIAVLGVPQVLLSLGIGWKEVEVSTLPERDSREDHPVPRGLVLSSTAVPHKVCPPPVAPIDRHGGPEGLLVLSGLIEMGDVQNILPARRGGQ